MRNYQRYKKLPEDQRRQLDQSYERWRGMNPGDRDRVRRNYQSYRQLDRQQREDFGRRYKQWRGGGGKHGDSDGAGHTRPAGSVYEPRQMKAMSSMMKSYSPLGTFASKWIA